MWGGKGKTPGQEKKTHAEWPGVCSQFKGRRTKKGGILKQNRRTHDHPKGLFPLGEKRVAGEKEKIEDAFAKQDQVKRGTPWRPNVEKVRGKHSGGWGGR